MNEIIYGALWAFFVLSLISNYVLLRYLKFERIKHRENLSKIDEEIKFQHLIAKSELEKAIQKAKDEAAKEPEKTYDVKALLADLSIGSALIRMERIDPHDVLLHSPRQSR